MDLKNYDYTAYFPKGNCHGMATPYDTLFLEYYDLHYHDGECIQDFIRKTFPAGSAYYFWSVPAKIFICYSFLSFWNREYIKDFCKFVGVAETDTLISWLDKYSGEIKYIKDSPHKFGEDSKKKYIKPKY